MTKLQAYLFFDLDLELDLKEALKEIETKWEVLVDD